VLQKLFLLQLKKLMMLTKLHYMTDITGKMHSDLRDKSLRYMYMMLYK